MPTELPGSQKTHIIFIFLFNSVDKIFFLSRKNIWLEFSPPPPTTTFANSGYAYAFRCLSQSPQPKRLTVLVTMWAEKFLWDPNSCHSASERHHLRLAHSCTDCDRPENSLLTVIYKSELNIYSMWMGSQPGLSSHQRNISPRVGYTTSCTQNTYFWLFLFGFNDTQDYSKWLPGFQQLVIHNTLEIGVYVFFYLIEQHSQFLLHTLQVLYMWTLCDSTNINTIIEFVPNCLWHVSGVGFNGCSDSYLQFRDTCGMRRNINLILDVTP